MSGRQLNSQTILESYIYLILERSLYFKKKLVNIQTFQYLNSAKLDKYIIGIYFNLIFNNTH